MVYESRDHKIIRKLKERYKIDLPMLTEHFKIPGILNLVIQADELLKVSSIEHTTVSVTANGYYSSDPVPSGYRWRLIAAYYVQSTGTFDVGSISVNDGTTRQLLTAPTAGGQQTYAPNTDAWIEAGWYFDIYCSNHSVNGNLDIYLWVEEIEIEAET